LARADRVRRTSIRCAIQPPPRTSSPLRNPTTSTHLVTPAQNESPQTSKTVTPAQAGVQFLFSSTAKAPGPCLGAAEPVLGVSKGNDDRRQFDDFNFAIILIRANDRIAKVDRERPSGAIARRAHGLKSYCLQAQPTSRPMKSIKRKKYEETLEGLQHDLIALQHWIIATGQRVVVIFEGRDAAGKGGVIKAIEGQLNNRFVRTVALQKPTDRESSQCYFQRYADQLPSAGELVLFDRSWYNRAGVEQVMGFCTPAQHKQFLADCPVFERLITSDGLILIKYWLSVDQEEQEQRFRERAEDPAKRWKLSPIDIKARQQYAAYGKARDAMLKATNKDYAPWFVVNFNDQKRGRLNLIDHLLKQLPKREPLAPAPPMPKLAGKPLEEKIPRGFLVKEAF
jgi:polyphosphate kinase